MDAKLVMFILLLVFLETIGQFAVRKYNSNRIKWYILLSIVCYIGIVLTLDRIYNIEEIGFVNAVWSGVTLLVVAILGYYAFEEQFSKQEIVAIILIFIGTILLGTSGRDNTREEVNSKLK